MDWGGLPFQDFGARLYDSQLGRWNAIDPMAHKYAGWSPYHYSLDSPVAFLDPDGNDATYYGAAAVDMFKQLQAGGAAALMQHENEPNEPSDHNDPAQTGVAGSTAAAEAMQTLDNAATSIQQAAGWLAETVLSYTDVN